MQTAIGISARTRTVSFWLMKLCSTHGRIFLRARTYPPVRRGCFTRSISLLPVCFKSSRTVGRLRDLNLFISLGWDENAAFKKGYFIKQWGAPDSWQDVILQGPHLFVAAPLYKYPNPTMLHQQDWSATDIETLGDGAIPITSYKPAGTLGRYDADFSSWQMAGGDGIVRTVRARDHFRVAWRRMAANTGEPTLVPVILPRGAAHVDGVFSFGVRGSRELDE